ncbi:MAG: hypothetical protein JO208_04240, partial [Alphaproteobacteria bacterium]|nr:hypothetical protein [Alphaproteobacteria bacterium]
MSKSTIAVLSSLLLSTALGLPAFAKTNLLQQHFPRCSAGAHFGHGFGEPALTQKANQVGRARVEKSLPSNSANFTIVDHQNADPSWGTRPAGINENGVLSG